MKKIFWGICFCCIGVLLWASPLSAEGGWKKAEGKIYDYVDDLSRKPDTPAYYSVHYRVRSLYFAVEPHRAHPIVFFGDSMTDEGDWQKLFPGTNLVNRGIGGDTTLGLLNRIDQVIALRPPKIFLMIGTNDLCFNRSIADTLKNYDEILRRLHTSLPETKIYIESVLPFNDQIFPSHYLRSNENIKTLNVGIRQLAEKHHDPYLDLVPYFSDADGRLPAEYTIDGLHLNADGYAIWKEHIKEFVQ